MAFLRVGDLVRAEAELRRFRQLAGQTPVLKPISGDGLYSLGRLMQLLERSDEARQYFAEAAPAYEQAGRTAQAVTCRYEIGWEFLLAGRAEEACRTLGFGTHPFQAGTFPELTIDLAIARGLYHSLRGEVDRADRLLLHLRRSEPLSCRQQADLFWILAENRLARGDRPCAETYLAEAWAAAAEAWWPPQMTRLQGLEARLREAGSPCRQGFGRGAAAPGYS